MLASPNVEIEEWSLWKMDDHHRRIRVRRERSHIEVELELECGHRVSAFPGNEKLETAWCVWCERASMAADGDPGGDTGEAPQDVDPSHVERSARHALEPRSEIAPRKRVR
jgi:hypothetical protein